MESEVKRTQRDYTLVFKLAVVEQVEKGDLSYKQAQERYGIQGRFRFWTGQGKAPASALAGDTQAAPPDWTSACLCRSGHWAGCFVQSIALGALVGANQAGVSQDNR